MFTPRRKREPAAPGVDPGLSGASGSPSDEAGPIVAAGLAGSTATLEPLGAAEGANSSAPDAGSPGAPSAGGGAP
jgi:hypothetical protein